MTEEESAKKYKEIDKVSYSAELHSLLDEARESIDITIPKGMGFDIPTALGKSDLSLAALIKTKPSSRKALVKEELAKAWNEVKQQLKNTIEGIPDAIAGAVIDLIFKILHEAVDLIVMPVDGLINIVLAQYNGLVRMIRYLDDPNLDKKLEEDIKKTAIEMLNNIYHSVPIVAEVIGVILLIDSIKKTAETLKSARTASAKNYDQTGKSINNAVEILNQKALLGSKIISMIVTFLLMLAPILAMLGAIFCGGKDFDSALDEAYNDYNKSEEETNDRLNPKSNRNSSSLIKQYAERELDGFTYKSPKAKKVSAENKTSDISPTEYPYGFTFSLCETRNGYTSWHDMFEDTVYTDDDSIGDKTYYADKELTIESGKCDIKEEEVYGSKIRTLVTKPIVEDFCHNDMDYMNACLTPQEDELVAAKLDTDNSKYAFIETDPTEIGELFVGVGDKIDPTSIIGKVNGYPFKPEICGTVISTGDNYIEVKEYDGTSFDELENRVNSILEQVQSAESIKSDIDVLIDKFNKLNNIKVVLRSYFPYLKISYIPSNEDSVQNITDYMSTDNIYKKYKNTVEDRVNRFADDIEQVTGKDHVEELLNADRMLDLKQEILNLDDAFYRDIIYIFNNELKNHSYRCDVEKIENYLILSDYEELYDMIDIDPNNEYTVELSSMLKDFIIERTLSEGVNKAAYISQFETFCRLVLGSKLNPTTTYIQHFNDLYHSYTYTMYSENMGEVSEEYKKMYEYLSNLMGCSDTGSNTKPVQFTSVEDISAQNSDAQSYIDQSKEELKKDLKKICRRFFLISDMNRYVSTSNKTLSVLKNMTSVEATRVKAYVNKIISEYNEYKDLVTGDCFDQFKEASSESCKPVYHNGLKHAHYYITPPNTNKDLYADNMPLSDELLDDFNSEASPRTQVPCDDIRYWLKYCTNATLVHCMLPMYWPCGIMITGPIPLPVIYIPIYYLKGDVSILFGLGICGMFIFPMIIFFNLTIDVKGLITIINEGLKSISKMLDNVVENNKSLIKDQVKEKIKSLEDADEEYEKDLQQLNIEISDVEEELVAVGKQRRATKEARKKKKAKGA